MWRENKKPVATSCRKSSTRNFSISCSVACNCAIILLLHSIDSVLRFSNLFPICVLAYVVSVISLIFY